MVTQIKITNYSPQPIIFQGISFRITIPGKAIDFEAQLPQETAQLNIQALRQYPYLVVSEIGVSEGLPTNDPLYIAPDYLADENYQGVWDASSGEDPHPAPLEGWYWRVSVAGAHSLDGIALWSMGDHVKWSGTQWIKVITWPERMRSHKNLIGIAGGATGEHYHLLEEEHTTVVNLTNGNFVFDGGVLEGGA